jgi:hypothetical protein
MEWLIYAILVLQIFSFVYGLLYLNKTDSSFVRLCSELLIILLLPVLGLICVLILHGYQPAQLSDSNSKEQDLLVIDYENSDFIKGYRKLPGIDYYNEIDVVPAEEILLTSDFPNRRRFMLNLLKADYYQQKDLIRVQSALYNEDTETAHYAASGLQRIRQKMEQGLEQLSDCFVRADINNSTIAEYADAIDRYLLTFQLDDMASWQLKRECIRAHLRLVKFSDMNRIERLIDLLTEEGHCVLAERCGLIMFRQQRIHEKYYLIMMKFYFRTRNIIGFNQMLGALRNSDIIISDEALNIIRLWSGVII